MKKQTVFDNWAGGVVTTIRPDALPNVASPRGRNSLLTYLANGQAVAAKRPGFQILNTAPISGRPAVNGQIEFVRHNLGSLTTNHVIVGNDGSLNKLVGSTISALDAGHPTPFTAGNLFPVFAVLNDLLFIVNGTDAKKVSSAGLVQNFGITAPSAGPTVADSGIAGTCNGSYDFAISYYNSLTGNESSLSGFNTQSVTSHKINVSWAAPADTQVDTVMVYIRKSSIMSQFFRLIVGTTPASGASGGFPIATTSIVVDIADATLVALTILAPTITENNPPPTGILSAAAHLSRMFVADSGNLYYSKPKLPEDFDPNNRIPVNPNDGQNIVTIGSFFERLVIWKSDAMYGLYGSDENSWYVDVIDPKIGCVATGSIVYFDGYLYWWSKQGPVRWDGSSAPQKIGQDFLAPTISRQQLNAGAFNQIIAGADVDTRTVVFAVPESGQTRNTLMLPWHSTGETWSSDGWNAIDFASFATVKDGNGTPWLICGGWDGRLFRYANANPDGARTADDSGNNLTLNGNVVSGTTTTMVDTNVGTVFDTKDDGLIGLYVYVIAPDGTVQRRRITANTATSITVATAWDAVPDSTFTYAIAAPYYQWDTPWTNDGEPFYQKKGLRCFSNVLSDSGSAKIRVDLYKDYDANTSVMNYSFSASGLGGIFDVSLFDSAFFGDLGITYNQTPIHKRFRHYRLRYSNIEPNSQVALMRASMEVSLLSEKVNS